MSKRWALICVAILLGGCASPNSSYDPFLGRSRVPAPSTNYPGNAPYYNGAPAAATPTMPSQAAPGAFTPPPGSYTPPPGASSQTNPPGTRSGAIAMPTTPSNQSRPQGLPTLAADRNLAATTAAMNEPPADDHSLDHLMSGTKQASFIAPSTGPTPAPPEVTPASFSEPVAPMPSASNSQSSDGGRTVVRRPESTADETEIRIVEPETATFAASTIDAGPQPWTASDASQSVNAAPVSKPSTIRLTSIPTRPIATSDSAGDDQVVTTSTLQTATKAPTLQTPLSGPAYGHDPSYATLQGRLEYSQSSRRWKLRYITLDAATDDFGGSVVLADTSQLQGYQPGDFVTVQGSIGQKADNRGFSPLYSVLRISKQ